MFQTQVPGISLKHEVTSPWLEGVFSKVVTFVKKKKKMKAERRHEAESRDMTSSALNMLLVKELKGKCFLYEKKICMLK